jgi:hypothetical protein
VSRTTGGPAEVLRKGSGIKVDGRAGHGLTISAYILRMPAISTGKRAAEPDLSPTCAEQCVLAQGSDQGEFFYLTGLRDASR